MHAKVFQEAAAAAMKGSGGSSSQALRKLASLGNSGVHDQNVERDLLRSCERDTATKLHWAFVPTVCKPHVGRTMAYTHRMLLSYDLVSYGASGGL